jgi:hypothetical protein
MVERPASLLLHDCSIADNNNDRTHSRDDHETQFDD